MKAVLKTIFLLATGWVILAICVAIAHTDNPASATLGKTVDQLLLEYRDPEHADLLFNGKRMRISGAVKLVGDDPFPMDVFLGPESPEIKGAVMLREPELMAEIRDKHLSYVAVECTIQGYRTAPAPVVLANSCRVL
jgi:hypothetical protein